MIDELQLGTLINKCKHLKYKFAGVYAADNFPPQYKERQLYHCQFRQGNSNGNSLAFAMQQKQQVLIR